MRVLFINPSSMPAPEMEAFLNRSSILRVPSFSMPIGLLDLSAFLRRDVADVDVQILDIGKDLYKAYLQRETTPPLSMRAFHERELDAVRAPPDVVGISILFSTAHTGSLQLAALVKQRWPGALVICGGNHATNLYAQLFKDPNIDSVALGEAEIPLVQFVRQLQAGGTPVAVPGIMTREAFQRGEPAAVGPMVERLDDMPLPAFDLLDLDCYRATVGGSLMFSRGCSFQCTFCASHTVHGRRLRFKSPERILREFALLVKDLGFRKVVIEDDLFAAKKEEFLSVARTLTATYRGIEYALPQGLSVAVLDEDIIDAMISMGINEAAVAIESGSPRVQKDIIRKNVSLPKARRILEYLRQRDFRVYVNFILGFPGETRELMQESIDFMKTLDVDWTYIFHALPLPGSDMYRQLVARGVISAETMNFDGLRLGRRAFDTPEISAADLEQLVYDTNIDVNFFGNSNLRCGRFQRAIEVFDRLILNSYPFHIIGRYCRGLAYLGLGDQVRAQADFGECVRWTRTNAESARLLQRYGQRMPLLTAGQGHA